jgi:alkaline phosphatase
MFTIKKHVLQLFLILSMVYGFSSCSEAQGTKTEIGAIPTPKNIIYFISDGMGFNHVKATNYYEFGEATGQVYEQDGWIQLAHATYPAVVSIRGSDTIFAAGYNPRAASQDPEYVKRDYTDSGAAGTAMSTGVKTYSGSIGLGVRGDTLVHISQAAKALGKAAGVVSSVQLSHATPAAFAAHNNHRNNYDEIARYMFFNTQLDVIMAAGNPDYNNNGQPEAMNPRFVGGREVWEMLKTNDGRTVFETAEGVFRVQDSNGDGNTTPWTVIQSREEFQQLASGNTPVRVLGVPKVYSTLQQSREAIGEEDLPLNTPYNETVPTLEEMTKAALNVLSQNKNGFFVMVEGGAVDWAGHSNQAGRMIEEQMDINNAVRAAVEWVEKFSNWDETLIIVTSDHETGYLTGPDDPDPIYQTVINNGKGQLPGLQWHSGSHTNHLVPLFAKGPGAEIFELLAGETDPVYGRFIQNADIANSIFLMWGKPEIEVHRLN